MSPVIRQHARELQTIADRLRTAIKVMPWLVVLIFPLLIALHLIGAPAIVEMCLAILPFLAAWSVMFFSFLRLHKGHTSYFFHQCNEDRGARTGIINKWVCGFCDTTHRAFKWYLWPQTVLHPCPKCRQTQHSLLCFKCDTPIVWDEEGFARSPKKSAWLFAYPPAPPVPAPAIPDRPPRRFADHLH
jgi:hypothetical protein